MTSSKEYFPECEGCLRFINNQCKDENAHLRDDCYQQRESFKNRAWEKRWEKLQSPN